MRGRGVPEGGGLVGPADEGGTAYQDAGLDEGGRGSGGGGGIAEHGEVEPAALADGAGAVLDDQADAGTGVAAAWIGDRGGDHVGGDEDAEAQAGRSRAREAIALGEGVLGHEASLHQLEDAIVAARQGGGGGRGGVADGEVCDHPLGHDPLFAGEAKVDARSRGGLRVTGDRHREDPEALHQRLGEREEQVAGLPVVLRRGGSREREIGGAVDVEATVGDDGDLLVRGGSDAPEADADRAGCRAGVEGAVRGVEGEHV